MGLEIISISLAVLGVILIIIYRRLISTFDYFSKRGVSGPKPTPIFGTWSGIWKQFQGEHDLLHGAQYGKVYGTFDGKTPNLIAAEPSFVQAMLGRESGSFRDRRAQSVKNPLLEQSLLLISNNQKLTQSSPKFVVHERIRSLVPLFLKAAENLRQNIDVIATEDEGRVNISKHVDSFVADSLALGVFGLDLNKSEELKKHFSKFCNQAFLNASPTSALSLIPFLYPSLTSQDGFVMSKDGLTFFATLCQSTINDKRENEKSLSSPVRDILSLYLEAADVEKQTVNKLKGVEEETTLNDQRITAECVAIILNTSLVSRNLVTLAVHTLATNSDVQDKLRSEISKKVQGNAISYEAIQGAKYLDMFMNEVARLYPSEFRVERICNDAMEVEKYKIEKGAAVSIPVYALHHSEEFYPKPEEFDPSRFSAEGLENRNPLTYLPFGQIGSNAGNISLQFALLAAKVAVADLVISSKFTPAEETQIPAKFVIGFTGVLRAQEIIVNAEARN